MATMEDWSVPILGSFFVASAFAAGVGWLSYSAANKIPNVTEDLELDYVVPGYLEIKVEDLDRNGGKEVLLKYGENQYLFKVDEQGKPVVLPYELKVIPKPEYD